MKKALVVLLVAVLAATLGSKVKALSWMTANNAIGISGLCALIIAFILTKAPAAINAVNRATITVRVISVFFIIG